MAHYDGQPKNPPRQLPNGYADGWRLPYGLGEEDEDLIGMLVDYPSDAEGVDMGGGGLGNAYGMDFMEGCDRHFPECDSMFVRWCHQAGLVPASCAFVVCDGSHKLWIWFLMMWPGGLAWAGKMIVVLEKRSVFCEGKPFGCIDCDIGSRRRVLRRCMPFPPVLRWVCREGDLK